MQSAILISAIGMGLVFLVILLLWAMMELLVRLIRDKNEPYITGEGETQNPLPVVAVDKRKVAAAAVAAALRLRRKEAAQLGVQKALAENRMLSETAPQKKGSNWLTVMRSTQREERLRLFGRKPKGS